MIRLTENAGLIVRSAYNHDAARQARFTSRVRWAFATKAGGIPADRRKGWRAFYRRFSVPRQKLIDA